MPSPAPLAAAALAALLAAAPALADGLALPDTGPDIAHLDRCMAGAEEPRTCIGTVFSDCVATAPEPDNSVVGWKETDIHCGARELAAWDAILNRDYRLLIERVGNFHDQAPEALRNAQRAWIDYRDAECYWPSVFLRGNDLHHNDVQCPLRQTAERAIELNYWAELLK